MPVLLYSAKAPQRAAHPAVTDIFGPQRCMLGSDLPIENLRSGFGPLYAAYFAIFSGFSDHERAMLFHRTAERWYAVWSWRYVRPDGPGR
jgi:predicted TIM-barrel fold metal-dependent hydrolase